MDARIKDIIDHTYYSWFKDELTDREALTEAIQEASRVLAEIAQNMPRSWDVNSPDPQTRISRAILTAVGIKP